VIVSGLGVVWRAPLLVLDHTWRSLRESLRRLKFDEVDKRHKGKISVLFHSLRCVVGRRCWRSGSTTYAQGNSSISVHVENDNLAAKAECRYEARLFYIWQKATVLLLTEQRKQLRTSNSCNCEVSMIGRSVSNMNEHACHCIWSLPSTFAIEIKVLTSSFLQSVCSCALFEYLYLIGSILSFKNESVLCDLIEIRDRSLLYYVRLNVILAM